MADPHRLMPHQPLPSSPFSGLKNLQLLVVAFNGEVDIILESLKPSGIILTYEVATTEQAYLSLLQRNTYDAVLFNAHYQDSVHRILFSLQQSGQTIPLILIIESDQDARNMEYLKTGTCEYLGKEQLWDLPKILMRSLEHQHRHHQVHGEQILQQINCHLVSNTPPNQILGDILQWIGEYLKLDRVILFEGDEQNPLLCQEWRVSEEIPSIRDNPLHHWQNFCVASRLKLDPRYEDGKDTNPPLPPSMIPLWLRDKRCGTMVVQTLNGQQPLSNSDCQWLNQVAIQVAIAFDIYKNRQVFQQQVQQRQALEAEKKRLESEHAAMSTFMATMSHDLRAPLTGILGFARMLLEEIYGPLNAKQTQYVSAIASSGEHLLELINDLLDISKIDANREELFIESVAVQDLCRASLSIVEQRAIEGKLELILDIAPDITVCQGDQKRLKQILVNLLSNGIKFTEQGSVTLEVKKEKDRLLLSVIDTGIGIPGEEQSQLFQPFKQLNTPLHRKHKGTGLGLALARKLARLHGGDLTLSSQENCGSCFTLVLPLNTRKSTN